MKLDNEQQKGNLLQIVNMYVAFMTGEPKPPLNPESMMQIGILTTQLKSQITQAEIIEPEKPKLEEVK